MYLNKAYIIGNLTRDPEVKALPSGVKVCNFSVATSRTYKDKDGERKETSEFHNIVAFSKLGELAGQYLKKGQQALIEGRLQTRSWDTAAGEKRYRTEIIADNIQFGFKAGGSGPSGAPSSAVNTSSKATDAGKEGDTNQPPAEKDKIDYPQEEINPDDIPF